MKTHETEIATSDTDTPLNPAEWLRLAGPGANLLMPRVTRETDDDGDPIPHTIVGCGCPSVTANSAYATTHITPCAQAGSATSAYDGNSMSPAAFAAACVHDPRAGIYDAALALLGPVEPPTPGPWDQIAGPHMIPLMDSTACGCTSWQHTVHTAGYALLHESDRCSDRLEIAWLNRPLAEALGLDLPPEATTGSMAPLDFAAALRGIPAAAAAEVLAGEAFMRSDAFEELVDRLAADQGGETVEPMKPAPPIGTVPPVADEPETVEPVVAVEPDTAATAAAAQLVEWRWEFSELLLGLGPG